ASDEIPLRLGSKEEFALVLKFFRGAGFDEQNVSEAGGIEDIAELGCVRWEEQNAKLQSIAPALLWCTQIFLRGLSISETETRTICGQYVLDAFKSLGLLRPSRKSPDSLVSPVWVYPVDGFVMASDRRDDPEGDIFTPAADVVFPAVYPGTLRFLKLLPEVGQGEALDLCGGSGIG